MSRDVCASMTTPNKLLLQTHSDLGHPGITRFIHLAKQNNLPYTIEEIRQVCSKCQTCCRFERRVPLISSLPTWITNSATAYLKNMSLRSKYDDKVPEVEIIEGNEKYATIKHSNGRQEIVSS
ncbi:hypothetical protein ACOME3_004548 [Neoechinorhynchus agilis]